MGVLYNIMATEKQESKFGELKRKLSEQVLSYSSQICVLLLVYVWGWLDFSFLWVALYLVGHAIRGRRRQKRENERNVARRIVEEGEENVLKSLAQLPSWVSFPWWRERSGSTA